MEQEKRKKSKLYLWLIIAVAALVVLGSVAAFILPGILGGNKAADFEPKLYWNLDRLKWVEEETGMSAREPDENGLYSLRFIVDGQIQEFTTTDKKLVNYIDTTDVSCLMFDKNGQILDAVDPSEYFTAVAKGVFVKRQQGNVLEANSSVVMNGMDFTFNLTEGVGPFDVKANAENPGAVISCQWHDVITAYKDLEGNLVAVYVTDNIALDGEIAWRVDRFYANGKTTRVPDENGVYTIEFLIEGQLVERKCKREDFVSLIDAAGVEVAGFTLEYDEEGYIDNFESALQGIRGYEICKNYAIDSIDGNTVTATCYLNNSEKGKQVTFTYDDSCKIYNVCFGKCQQHQFGEEIKLQVNDSIIVYSDLDRNPKLIYVTLHGVDVPMYYNIEQKYNTVMQSTVRKPNEDGYYVFKMASEGKVKTVKTKDINIANQIDSNLRACVGLELEGSVVKKVYSQVCVSQGFTSFYGNKFTTNVIGTIVSVADATSMGNASNYIMSPNCKVYMVDDNYNVKLGSLDEVQLYDRVTGILDMHGELSHVYITQRYRKGHTLCYNTEQRYDYVKYETTRVPDADGYYVYNICLNGVMKQYKTKSKTMADFIDKQNPGVMGIKVSGDKIVSVCTAATTLQCGMKYYNTGYVYNTDGGMLSGYYIDAGVRFDYGLSYKLNSSTKVYNCSEHYSKNRGEKGTLKANDRIQGVVDILTGEIKYVAIMFRCVNSPLYWNTERKYDDSTRSTSRVPDANGYYVFKLAVDGKIKEFKTKDKAVATSIDQKNELAFGLILDGKTNIVTKCLPASNTPNNSLTVNAFDITSINGNTITAKRCRLSSNNYGEEKTFTINSSTKIIDVSSYAKNFGAYTKLKVGDRVHVYTNLQAETGYVFVLKAAARDKGVFAYCSHCNKKVFWDAYSETLMADNAHYYLPADMTLSMAIDIGKSTDNELYNAVFDLNGHSITSAGRVFNVYDKLTIMDSVGGGKIVGGTATNYNGLTQGGNIMVYEGATLNVVSGKIVDGKASPSGVGSNISAYNATVNISGGTISGGVGYLGTAVYHSGTKGGINISGGTISGSVFAKNTKMITLSGKPSISKLIVEPGDIVKLGALKSGASITVKASGVFTNTASGINTLKGYFKPASTADSITVSSGALKYTNNSGSVIPTPESANKPLVLNNGMGVCAVCGENVKWTAIYNGQTIGNMETSTVAKGSHLHYYIAEDMTSGDGDFLYNSKNMQVCLNLNGKTLNLRGGFYGSNLSVLNIMGNGTVNYLANATTGNTRNCLFNYWTASVNIYGGTFNSAKTFLNGQRALTAVTIAQDADIRAAVNVSMGTLAISGGAKVQKINIGEEGKLYVDGNFTGRASISPDAGLDGAYIPKANAEALDDFVGALLYKDGRNIQNDKGKLKVVGSAPSINTALSLSADGEGFCYACGEVVKWTAVNNGQIIGNVETNGTQESAHLHYYVAEDMTSGDGDFWYGSKAVQLCLHLNGKTLKLRGGFYGSNGSTLNIIGSGTVNHLANATTGNTKTFLFNSYYSYVNLYGGTFNASASFLSAQRPLTSVTVTEDAIVNEIIDVNNGTFAIGGNAKVNKVNVGADAKFVVNKGFAGSAVMGLAVDLESNILPEKNAAATGTFTGSLTYKDGRALSYQNGRLALVGNAVSVNAPLSLDSNGDGFCNACGYKVHWTKVTGGVIGTLDASSTGDLHFYIDNDMVSSDGKYFIIAKGGVQACLHLNGKTVNINGTNGGIHLEGNATLNIMGTGTLNYVKGNLSSMFGVSSGKLNLYGGTYESNANFMNTVGTAFTVSVLEDAVINETLKITQGNLVLGGKAKVQKIDLDGGKLTVNKSFTGSAVLDVADSLMNGQTVKDANGATTGNFTGSIVTPAGKLVKNQNNKLVVTTTTGTVPSQEDAVIDPYAANLNFKSGTKTAYCPYCGQDKEWTAYTGTYTESNMLNDPGVVNHYHFYLENSVEYTSQFLVTNENICFHLNGKNITASGSSATYAFASSQRLCLMGTGTVTGGKLTSTAGAAVNVNGGGGSSTAIIYTGVTLKKVSGAQSPIVNIGQNGGNVILNGGVIDATGSTSSGYPAAVFVQGGNKQSNSNYSPAVFTMNYGEIIGGNASNGGAVRVGYGGDSDTTRYGKASFVMNNGRISGGNAATGGGNVYISTGGVFDMNGGTISGGTAGDCGGNVQVASGSMDIAAGCVISGGTAKVGGNVAVIVGTLNTAGNILDGTAKAVKNGSNQWDGRGGNIYLNSNTDLFITGGVIAGGKITKTGAEAWSSDAWGGNIRSYNADITITNGYIYGGEGGSVAGGQNITAKGNGVLTISGGTIAGDIETTSGIAVNLSGAPVIAKTIQLADGSTASAKAGGLGITDGNPANITDLTQNARICVSFISGTGFDITKANANASGLLSCFSAYDNVNYQITHSSQVLYYTAKS